MNPLTACQKEYQKLLRRWRQPSNRYIPRCSADGSYAQVQCAGGVCFCVSSQGKEIPGTKTVNSARQPNCTHTGNLHYLNYIYIYIWDPIYRSTNMMLILKSMPSSLVKVAYFFHFPLSIIYLPLEIRKRYHTWMNFHFFVLVFVFRCEYHTLRKKAPRLYFLFKEIYSFL